MLTSALTGCSVIGVMTLVCLFLGARASDAVGALSWKLRKVDCTFTASNVALFTVSDQIYSIFWCNLCAQNPIYKIKFSRIFLFYFKSNKYNLSFLESL